jgi:LuxR family transcriptional regulator, maltose regulon positive regulatory protein
VNAGKEQSGARRERRIIERPRLIKLLDESEARIILLLAPAGYGKTTLARQWAKTLSGTIWLTLTPAHRDVVTLAEDIAVGIEALGGGATNFIREYLRAQSNPQRAAHGVALELAKQMNEVGVKWLIVDDCHEIATTAEACFLIAALLDRLDCRMLMSARERPSWTPSRQVVYGRVTEFDRDDLAMTTGEAAEVLGPRPDLAELALQAEGWPAVLSLAAALDDVGSLRAPIPETLHSYLAEELFQSASDTLRERLVTLALLPRLTAEALTSEFGEDRAETVDQAYRLGFITGDTRSDLHPLLREFLLSKLQEKLDAPARVRKAISNSVAAGEWEHALGLVLRFNLNDLVDPVLTPAFSSLARRGLVGTLSEFASQVRLVQGFPPATVDLVDAEIAMREGHLQLAIDLADRAHEHLERGHPLRSRAMMIAGQGHLLLASFDEAEAALASATTDATDARDTSEAIHGLLQVMIFGERGDLAPVLKVLFDQRHESPAHLLRYAIGDLNRRRFDEGLGFPLRLEEALHTLPRVDDPRIRTSFTYSLAYAFALRADYDEAEQFSRLFLDDIRSFDLEFALPYANWTSAMIFLGLREFGKAERSLQAVEDASKHPNERRHAVNARSLRARMLLQTGQPLEALQQVQPEVSFRLIPSWLGEYIGTRALILSCLGRTKDALETANRAISISRAGEVRMLAATTRGVCATSSGDQSSARTLAAEATALSIWDPVVCGLRASPELADAFARDEALHPLLEPLYQRSRDLGLARKAGFRTRSPRHPNEILSPRELEVIGLIARGFRNREISGALFIADSTTKVHVRHILEKLGVRTRAEAVARYEMFATLRGADSS